MPTTQPFRSIRSCLRWYARATHHDGCRAIWPDPTKADFFGGQRLDFCERLLTMWAIWRVLQTLTDAQQHLLALYHVEEQPIIDIAAKWHRHPSRVYSLLTRATDGLADGLRKEGLLHRKMGGP